ncbi:5-(carboxyamino)imidazole ribonucleotide synthase [Kallotenue papyrolyticum]|uniref:5-(carboxyamino)imidazole ribonucleotide synthase n=1 Tax=Kallotenue papyrolyticum TaxID=1325125 RepID=UPI0004729A08|nr:5-(carboxyamino)imidazole ribonucleotide synthase [Kallotenue papyrolyticum]
MAELQRLGILGGGQLARMTLQAAIGLGIDTVIVSEAPDSPAGRVARREIVGDIGTAPVQAALIDCADVITLENEFIDAAILERLAERGATVLPGGATLRLVQDKLIQKQTLAAQGLPVPAFRAVETPDDLRRAAAEWGWPLVLKARRNGYDGYGNATLRSADDIQAALTRLGWPQRALFVEQGIAFARELAVLVARRSDGATVVYPVVETTQRNHICHVVRAPAPIPAALAERAVALAHAAVAAVGGVGITAVELFQVGEETILINELAPRPHNSGHFSIEACVTSQFENHVRAVLGLPLGATDLRAPAAVMVNLLGERDGTTSPYGLDQALALPDTHLHLYGKREVRRGRKMGHVTALADDLATAEQRARAAASAIRL